MTAGVAVEAASVDTSAPAAPVMALVRCHSGHGWEHVTGELTENPNLAITPEFVSNGAGGVRLTGEWTLTHLPTGMRFGRTADVEQWRDFARLVAHLDWSREGMEWWELQGPGYGETVRHAWKRATR